MGECLSECGENEVEIDSVLIYIVAGHWGQFTPFQPNLECYWFCLFRCSHSCSTTYYSLPFSATLYSLPLSLFSTCYPHINTPSELRPDQAPNCRAVSPVTSKSRDVRA